MRSCSSVVDLRQTNLPQGRSGPAADTGAAPQQPHGGHFDGTPGSPGMQRWVGVLDLADGLDAILLDPDETLTIHDDRTKLENAYLNDVTDLPAGLTLVAYGPTPNVPEPGTLALLGISLAVLAASRWRRQ